MARFIREVKEVTCYMLLHASSGSAIRADHHWFLMNLFVIDPIIGVTASCRKLKTN